MGGWVSIHWDYKPLFFVAQSQILMSMFRYPADTPYLFFRARCDGSSRHAFAGTFDEHLRNGCP
jgi:cell division protein YceG involved in septum cleavage